MSDAPPSSRAEPRMFLAALLARAGILLPLLIGHAGSLSTVLLSTDAPSYVAVADMLASGLRPVSAWHERVFLGWPLTFFAPGAVLGQAQACVLLAVLLAACVPVLYHRLTGDAPSAWFLATLTPTWLMHSTLGMSEPAFLAYQLGALLAHARGRSGAASALCAAALVVRPNAVFVWLAIAWELLAQRRWGRLVAHGVIAAAATGAVLALNAHFYGDPLRQSHLYSDLPNIGEAARQAIERLPFSHGHLGPPFLHLIATPFVIHVPAWKIAFVWAHVAVALGACGVGFARRDGSALHRVMLTWAVLNTLFIVSTGPYWGFHSFDRYFVWGLPAYGYLLRSFVPRGRGAWLALSVLSVALALWSQARSLQ